MLAHIGSAVVDDNGYLKSAKALKLSFIMDNSTKKKKKAGEILSQVEKYWFLLNIVVFLFSFMSEMELRCVFLQLWLIAAKKFQI